MPCSRPYKVGLNERLESPEYREAYMSSANKESAEVGKIAQWDIEEGRMDEQRAGCAHSKIDYSREPAGQGVNLAGGPVDLVRDCWKCRECGTEFTPVPWVKLAVAESPKELQTKLKAAEARVRELTEAFEKEPKQPKTFADNLDDYL